MKTPSIASIKFVTGWLWESRERKTEGREWDLDYVHDAACMIEAAREGMVSKQELRKLVLWAEAVWARLPYAERCEVNLRDLEHARSLLGESKENK